MNNFRHPHPKPFGGRGAEMSSPWMTDEEFLNMRRQNPQYHSPMHNVNPSMHSPLLNQGNMFPPVNKNFMNQSPCKMPNSNFTSCPNPEIFKSPLMNEQNYQNRFLGNRFPNNSYSPMNMQPKMNDSPSYKDFVPSRMMPSQGHRSDGFPDCISKPLLSNVRPSQDTFSCMQNDQSQFNSKYDNSRMFPEKNFPFSNEKDFQSHNHTPINEPASLGSNFSSYKPSYRAPSLFPAYTPKTMSDESTKNIPVTTYNSDFTSKANNFCDKTETPSTFDMKTSSYCDKSLTSSVVYSTSMESFPGKSEQFQAKTESFQGKVDSFQEKIDAFQNKAESFLERSVSDRIVNEFFPPHSASSSFMFEKQPVKTTSNSQLSHDTFKTVEDPVALSSNPKFVYPPSSQEPCLSTEISMQKSPMLPNHPSTTSSKDCLMQNVPFTSQSDIQQNLKDNFSSINFESNISTTDIADLLPGIDAFLKEHLEKSDEIVPKNDTSKTASNCTFSDDEWSKHSIPFIGDNLSLNDGNIQDSNKEASCDQSICVKETSSDHLELKLQKETEIPAINEPVDSAPVVENVPKMSSAEKEEPKLRSALEEAIELLVTNDTIVGLDYIIEYKRNIAQEGSIPFRCKLCNSAITRPSIIDHILGSKHRMRYLKAKNEPKYEQIINLKLEKSEKDAVIAEAVSQLEKIHGRGRVIVDSVEYQKDSNVDHSSKEVEEGTVEPVFTLDKIPIGFEALSPQHEEINEFSLENSINQMNEGRNVFKNESPNRSSAGIIKDTSCVSAEEKITLPGLGCDTIYDNKTNSDSILSQTIASSVEQNICNVTKDSDKTEVQHSQTSSVKRSVSPDSSFRSKIQKTDSEESKPDTTDLKKLEVKNEDSHDLKGFGLNLLEKLSKSTISSEEEASVVLQVINVLMELLLRYKLQHLSVEKVEKLMKSLQTKSPENIEELSSLLKDCNVVENKNVGMSTSSVKDNDSIHLKSDTLLEEDSQRQIKQEYSNSVEKRSMNISDSDLPEKNISDNFASESAMSTKITQSISDIGTNTSNFTVSQSLAALDNTTDVSKNVTEFSCMSQTTCLPSQAQTQTSSSGGLKPPPFFNWPQTSEAATNQVSYANVQGSQNMMWTSPYQHTQTQYAQLPYYQQQNYANTYSGTQAYQAQYSVLSQSSVPMKMAQPPLPPPPPPPPPAPSNPPLPPLPSSIYTPSVSSHSIQMPINTPPCGSMYSKQTFLPPPLP